MYLSMLDNEKRHLFLNLEIYMSKVDGDFSEEEKDIINTHCVEMHIDNNNYEPDMSRDVVFERIKDTLSRQEKKIVFLELVGTILADKVYHEAERELTDKLSGLLEISQKEAAEAFSIVSDMKANYERCAKYIS